MQTLPDVDTPPTLCPGLLYDAGRYADVPAALAWVLDGFARASLASTATIWIPDEEDGPNTAPGVPAQARPGPRRRRLAARGRW